MPVFTLLTDISFLEEIRNLLWHADEYYREFGKLISETWLDMTPGAAYEKDPDYEDLKALKGEVNDQKKKGRPLNATPQHDPNIRDMDVGWP